MPRRLLAVHAHPDDESSKGAATYAHYVDSGAEVLVVTCTGGERGGIQNPTLDAAAAAMAERDMAGLRRLEMAAAREAVGFEHRWLGFFDSGLPENGEPLEADCFALIPLEVSAEPLVALIREFRPQVMVTYDENGGYPHPDHVRTHELSMYALEAAADAARYPHAGPAWQIQKVYYDRIFNSPRANAMYEKLQEEDPESPLLGELASDPTSRRATWRSARSSTTATAPCARTPARLPRTATSSSGRTNYSARCGRGRTTSSSPHSWRPSCPRTTCSRASPRQGRDHDARRAAAFGGRHPDPAP